MRRPTHELWSQPKTGPVWSTLLVKIPQNHQNIGVWVGIFKAAMLRGSWVACYSNNLLSISCKHGDTVLLLVFSMSPSLSVVFVLVISLSVWLSFFSVCGPYTVWIKMIDWLIDWLCYLHVVHDSGVFVPRTQTRWRCLEAHILISVTRVSNCDMRWVWRCGCNF